MDKLSRLENERQLVQALLVLQEDLACVHRMGGPSMGEAVVVLEAAQDRCDAVLWMAERLLAGGTEENI